MKMAKAALCMIVALALTTSCAFAGRVLNEHPAPPPIEAPLPADPLPSDAAGAAGVAPAAGAAVGACAAAGAGQHPLTFFMHDILGASSQPSALMVTGVAASAAGLVNGNSVVPYDSLVQSNGDTANGGYNYKNTIHSINAGGSLPSATTPRDLLFGMTAIVDEKLAGGHDLGAAAVGRAQGFYVASSQDGSSKTVVLTAMFGGEVHGDTLSFFGVHRMAAPESRIAVVGGTGKYENARGFAAIRTPRSGDQHSTDGGVEGLLQFDIHLS